MPKPLLHEQPSSAVARLLDPGVGRAALAESGRLPQARRPAEAQRPTGEVPTIKREFILTPSADEALKQLALTLSQATGSEVTNSHLLRSVLRVLAGALPSVEREAMALGPLRRPGNARGREAERERYEEALAGALDRALRKAE